MPLAEMLVNRHTMSHTVRAEVSPKSHEWGYQLGSVYIRKVHFRDLRHDPADREQRWSIGCAR